MAAENNGELYPQSTYLGRLRHFARLTSPLSLFKSDADLRAAKLIVQDNKRDLKFWDAKYLVDSTVHPDTGEKILLPFRMASFVPTNVPIIALMLIPNPSMALIVGSQWLNQSGNVAFNYFNANKSAPMSTSETLLAYSGACGSSVSIALGLSYWVKHYSPIAFRNVFYRNLRVVPFVAVAAAGTVNIYLMRQKELTEGISVTDEDGRTLDTKSQVAGSTAIKQVAISRIVTSAPALFVPAIIMDRLSRYDWFKSRPRLNIPVQLLTITASLMVALPLAIALFPQTASVAVCDAEQRFAGVKRVNGEPVQRLFFNRGL